MLNDFSNLGMDELSHLIQQKISFQEDDIMGDFFLNPNLKDEFLKYDARKAAVLIPIVARQDGPCAVFTMRTKKLKSHSGQISFPGGKIDEQDACEKSAALREAHEEIGLHPDQVEVIGRLPTYLTGSRFEISPFIGLVDENAVLNANPDEVEYIFEVPFSFLMNENNYDTGSIIYDGSPKQFYQIPYQENHIWGVTAGIVRILHDRLKA